MPAQVLYLQHGFLAPAVALRVQAVQLPPDHHVDDGILVSFSRFHRPHQLAVFQHGHPVGDGKNLVQFVADIDDSQSLFPQLLQAVEQALRLPLSDGRCRLIEDQDLGVALNGARNFHDLLHRHVIQVQGVLGINLDIEVFQGFGGGLVHVMEADEAGLIHWLGVGEYIFGYRHHRCQSQVLEHGADAQLLSFLRVPDLDRLTAYQQLAAVGLVDASHDKHESGFSSAIFTHQCVDFPGHQLEVDLIQG